MANNGKSYYTDEYVKELEKRVEAAERKEKDAREYAIECRDRLHKKRTELNEIKTTVSSTERQRNECLDTLLEHKNDLRTAVRALEYTLSEITFSGRADLIRFVSDTLKGLRNE